MHHRLPISSGADAVGTCGAHAPNVRPAVKTRTVSGCPARASAVFIHDPRSFYGHLNRQRVCCQVEALHRAATTGDAGALGDALGAARRRPEMIVARHCTNADAHEVR